MRHIALTVLLSILGLTNAGKCIADSAEAMSDAMDSFAFTWAAMKRCGDGGDNVLRCEIDISSMVKSTTSMINIILDAVKKCGGFKVKNKHNRKAFSCGLKASALTEHSAGLAASGGEVLESCRGATAGSPGTHNVRLLSAIAAEDRHNSDGSPIMCSLDMKDTATNIFKATRALYKMKKKCKKDGTKCASNLLDMVASFSAMGEYMAGAVGSCKEVAGSITADEGKKALCAQAVSSAIHQTMKVSQAFVDVSRKCEVQGEFNFGGHGSKHGKPGVHTVPLIPPAAPILPRQALPAPLAPPPVPQPVSPPVAVASESPEPAGLSLYDRDIRDAPVNYTSLLFLMGALLPVTVVVSFFGGRLYAARTAPPLLDYSARVDHYSAREMTVDLTPRAF